MIFEHIDEVLKVIRNQPVPNEVSPMGNHSATRYSLIWNSEGPLGRFAIIVRIPKKGSTLIKPSEGQLVRQAMITQRQLSIAYGRTERILVNGTVTATIEIPLTQNIEVKGLVDLLSPTGHEIQTA